MLERFAEPVMLEMMLNGGTAVGLVICDTRVMTSGDLMGKSTGCYTGWSYRKV
jgi:hypothetical protein